MKPFPAIYLIAPILVLSSCGSYQYVNPLPSTPHFTESGEVQGQLAVGVTHYEIQGSVSFLKNFGAGFTAYNAPNSAIRSYTFHYFRQGKKWQNLYTTGFLGYDKGYLKNETLHPVWGDSHIEKRYSNYETFRAGGGMYFSPSNKRVQFGYFLSFQQIQFYKMDVLYQTINYSAAEFAFYLRETQRYMLASPNFSFTVFSSNRIFFLRQHLLFEVPIGDPLNVHYVHGLGLNSSPNSLPATIRPRINQVMISMSIGMRLIPLNLLKRKI